MLRLLLLLLLPPTATATVRVTVPRRRLLHRQQMQQPRSSRIPICWTEVSVSQPWQPCVGPSGSRWEWIERSLAPDFPLFLS